MMDETGEPMPTSDSGPRRRVAVVASLTLSLTNFRLELLKRMVEAGHEVIAFAPDRDADVEHMLKTIGVRFIRIPMQRTGLNPLAEPMPSSCSRSRNLLLSKRAIADK